MEKTTLIAEGRTAEVYNWGKDRVLKLYQNWLPASVAEREYTITRAAQTAGLPVPNTYELLEIEGRCGIVFEKIDGVSLLNALQAKPWTLFSAARQLGELHAQIHDCQASITIPGQRQQIEEGIEAAQDITENDKQTVREYLSQLPEEESLCHGDFHPNNILLTARGPIIIDWMTGTRGHPLADVARTSLIFQTVVLPPGTPIHVRILANTSRTLLHRIYLNRYLQLRPAKQQQIDQWQLPLRAARLREVGNCPQEKHLLMTWMEAELKNLAQRPFGNIL